MSISDIFNLDMSSGLEIPLSPAVFFTLLSLSGGEKHGYAIMQESKMLSDNKFRMGPAALYTTIQRLLELHLIVEIAGEREGDRRRRNYRLTATGRGLLDAELNRIEELLTRAKAIHLQAGEADS
jgi:PadR family transcriptional regulator PadR